MSQKSRKGRKKRGRGKKRRRGQNKPGWHVKLASLKRKAREMAPMIQVADLRHWELHLSFHALEHEPWKLVAHPKAGQDDWSWTWLGKAAEFLGAPADEKPTQPKKGFAVISWSWKD